MGLFKKSDPTVSVDIWLSRSGARLQYSFSEPEAVNLINDWVAFMRGADEGIGHSKDFALDFADVSAIVYY